MVLQQSPGIASRWDGPRFGVPAPITLSQCKYCAGGPRRPPLTPLADHIGTTTITVTVTDASGQQASDMFLLTVSGNTLVPFALPAAYSGARLGW